VFPNSVTRVLLLYNFNTHTPPKKKERKKLDVHACTYTAKRQIEPRNLTGIGSKMAFKIERISFVKYNFAPVWNPYSYLWRGCYFMASPYNYAKYMHRNDL
jgi:hypothetical protein